MKIIANLFTTILLASIVIITPGCNKDDVWYAGQCNLTGQVYYVKSDTNVTKGSVTFYATKGVTTCPQNPSENFDQMAGFVDGEFTYYDMSKGDYYIYVEYTDSLGTKYTGGEHIEVTEDDYNLRHDIYLK